MCFNIISSINYKFNLNTTKEKILFYSCLMTIISLLLILILLPLIHYIVVISITKSRINLFNHKTTETALTTNIIEQDLITNMINISDNIKKPLLNIKNIENIENIENKENKENKENIENMRNIVNITITTGNSSSSRTFIINSNKNNNNGKNSWLVTSNNNTFSINSTKTLQNTIKMNNSTTIYNYN